MLYGIQCSCLRLMLVVYHSHYTLLPWQQLTDVYSLLYNWVTHNNYELEWNSREEVGRQQETGTYLKQNSTSMTTNIMSSSRTTVITTAAVTLWSDTTTYNRSCKTGVSRWFLYTTIFYITSCCSAFLMTDSFDIPMHTPMPGWCPWVFIRLTRKLTNGWVNKIFI